MAESWVVVHTVHLVVRPIAARYILYMRAYILDVVYVPPHSLRLPSGERRIDFKKKKKNYMSAIICCADRKMRGK